MYMAVIIGVDAMVYAVCKRGRQFNPSPIHIKGLVSQSLEVFLKKIDVCRVHIDFAKIQEVLCESDVGRVQVDFTQIQSFFKKLPSIECVSISSKFRESFVKLIFTKFGGFFAKISSMDGGLISPKFGGFQAACSSQEQHGGSAKLDRILVQCDLRCA